MKKEKKKNDTADAIFFWIAVIIVFFFMGDMDKADASEPPKQPPIEFQNAITSAKSHLNREFLTSEELLNKLVNEDKFTKESSKNAVEETQTYRKDECLKYLKSREFLPLSKAKLELMGKARFTEEEIEHALSILNYDYKEVAVDAARNLAKQNFSTAKISEIMSEHEWFTEDEIEYAVENMDRIDD